MKNILSKLKRYRIFIALLMLNLVLLFVFPETGSKAFQISWKNLLEMLAIVPPIFVLLGLLDVWISKDTMIKLMGEKSGFTGIIIAFLMGSVATGPLYAAFPVATVLLKKGSKLSNVFIFIGAWSTTKIPLLLFEASALGTRFALIRLAINIPGIALIAFLSQKVLSKKDKEEIYALANKTQE